MFIIGTDHYLRFLEPIKVPTRDQILLLNFFLSPLFFRLFWIFSVSIYYVPQKEKVPTS
jgi:hypothetical protein